MNCILTPEERAMGDAFMAGADACIEYDCDPEQGPPLDCHFNPYLPGTDLAEECDRGWCEFYGK